MANNEAEYRKERVEKNRDLDTLITEETGDKNIFEKKIFDVLEYIENEAKAKGNLVAKKILKLKEYGITDAQIVEYYKDGSNAIENENTAISRLDTVFSRLVAFINNLPNGIVIDLETAEKNDDKSFEQAIIYGIYSEDSIVENLNKTIIKEIENFWKTPDNEKIEFLLENFKDIYIYNPIINREMGIDIDDILKKNENEMNLSDSLKSFVKDNKEIIENSPYETDPYLFEICRMQAMLKGAKSSQDYNLLLSKITAFYKEHPNYIGKALPIFNQDGSLNQEEIIKMHEYSEAYQKLIILEHIDTFNGMTPQELANLDPIERKHMMMCAFSGLKYVNDGNEKHQELVKESMKMIKQMYPNLDLNNGKQLADFFKEVSGIDANFESLSLQELIGIYSHQLKEATEDYLEKDTEAYIGKKIDFTKLDLDSSERKLFDSPMKNYFVGSNINFTEKDEQEYNKLYQDVTLESWIETKENAIKLRYAALTTIRDEYKNNPVGTYTEKKLVEIERDIAEFESKYGKIDLTEKDGEVSFDVYREDFVKAGLTKYLTRDAREWSQGADYKNLSDEHKKGYIRNILVALDENKDPNSYMTKIALRRLELMGDDFVKFNPDGTFEINEDLILEEYKKLSDYNYPSYEQLAESAKLRKNEYLLKKLEEYTNLPENSFVKGIVREPPEVGMAQIEEARYLSNQKRIEQFVESSFLKNLVKENKKIIENSQYESDPYLFEICRLQVMLKGAKSSQDYNLLLSKITDFYKKHPNYTAKTLPVLNQDGSLNQEEIIKMHEYSEAYQKLIILEHIDTFNGMTPKELANLDPTERKHMMMCAFSGLKYVNDGNEKHQELVKESMKMIKQMYPNLDLNNGQQLAEFFKEVSGIDANFASLSLQELVGIYSHQLKEATEDYLEKDTEAYIGKKIDFTKLDIDSSENRDDTKITDRDIFESVKGGTLEVEVLNVSKNKRVTEPQIPRDEAMKNQEEQDEQNGGNGETSEASEMKVTTMDTTAVTEGLTQKENVKPTFIENVKNVFARVKDAISKIIKNEEKPKELGSGRRELTEEEKKAKYEETFRPVDSSQASRPVEVTTATSIQTPERDEER